MAKIARRDFVIDSAAGGALLGLGAGDIHDYSGKLPGLPLMSWVT